MGPFGLFPPFRAIRPTRPMPAPPPPHYVPSVDGLPPLDALDQAHQVNRAAATRQLRTPVLVVDDSPDVRLTVCQLLTLAGYVVVEAPEGRTGLQVLRSAPARVVALLDLVMPVLDGAGVLRVVADDPYHLAQHAYVLLTDGDRLLSADLIGLLRRLGVPVLWKPFTPTALLDTVAHAGLRLAAAPLRR